MGMEKPESNDLPSQDEAEPGSRKGVFGEAERVGRG